MPAVGAVVAIYGMYESNRQQKKAAAREEGAMRDRKSLAAEEKGRWREQVAPIINNLRAQGLRRGLTDHGKLALGSFMNKMGEVRRGLDKRAGNQAGFSTASADFGVDMETAKGRGLLNVQDNIQKQAMLRDSGTMAAQTPGYVGYEDKAVAAEQEYYGELNKAYAQQFAQNAQGLGTATSQLAEGWAAKRANPNNSWWDVAAGTAKRA